MNKIADIVFIVLGIISIIGSVFLMYGISVFDDALNDILSLDAASAANLGLDLTRSQQLARQVKAVVQLGWIWSIIVLVSSLALIYFAVADWRRQRSIIVRRK